jgi:hypothetical protein
MSMGFPPQLGPQLTECAAEGYASSGQGDGSNGQCDKERQLTDAHNRPRGSGFCGVLEYNACLAWHPAS